MQQVEKNTVQGVMEEHPSKSLRENKEIIEVMNASKFVQDNILTSENLIIF